ncbi:Uncharacterised protein [Nocardia otitidiscaviarum]|uniref:Uncharacterized protein n=1 Tax=Nocardia otitidiscaviarum TaxID=1823 RepID=A0A378YRG0_9NOCA|nr:hypothetical protein [Nocardia otitidiscaviarum]SUA79756.1 Uncharacterised protein [Nocardia otitidiscaviarum]
MRTIRNYRRSALLTAALGATATALVATAAPAVAANSIDVTGVGPANIGIDYSCEPTAGVVAAKVLVGAPEADSPSASGSHSALICDGSARSAVIALTGAPLSAGQTVQVRVALVDHTDTVVSGRAEVVTLG